MSDSETDEFDAGSRFSCTRMEPLVGKRVFVQLCLILRIGHLSAVIADEVQHPWKQDPCTSEGKGFLLL